jgi:hypothetical protein
VTGTRQLKSLPIVQEEGLLLAHTGRLEGIYVFGKPKTFASVFLKDRHSYGLDAIDWLQGEKETPVSKESV